ncbi:MAG: hypothetical protein ACI9W2_002741 [Gammaproteobacteria bacterium]|jgi:uncharacterized protein YbjT (DUF2867 family)
MRVGIVGGTGFVGNYLVEAFLEKGLRPVLLVRPGSEHKVRRRADCELISGNVNHMDDIVKVLKNCEAAVYNVGILREERSRGITFESLQYEGAARVVDAASAGSVQRLLLMSANGVKQQGTPYQATKYRAEQYALASSLEVTVFQPSVIFGDPHGAMEFATQLCRDMVAPPIPAVGFFNACGAERGHIRMSPVHVEDVADAFAASLHDSSTIGQTIMLAGPESLIWQEILRRVAEAVGRKKWLLPMPIELMKLAASLLDWLPAFPVTGDQLTMLAESNTGDPAGLSQLTGRKPKAFSADSLAYLARWNDVAAAHR